MMPFIIELDKLKMVLQMFFLIVIRKLKLILMILYLQKKMLTWRNVIALIKSVFNKDQNHYSKIFLEKCSYK